ncbi:chemotaxis protein MotB [Yoonia rosea]|uniref:Chemotaxis protein MotB n=1 Tax=Yoonia rosea TaxID=287098 RepID=A0A1R3XE41_9RHOB|nr:peptidoglycan -binding protein [Yoonia rosea]SIT89036.1 chemotaxis protein MotB [Yoonia rosea]
MALSRRSSNRFQNAIWPGFVDAMTGLLLVLMFVLTIFMVIQFVLRQQITGQETELDALNNEVAALTATLGLARDTNASLTADLDAANAEATRQAGRIAALIAERDAQDQALAQAQTQITQFEAQVAGLLSARSDALANIAGLEAEQERLLSEQEALNLALAQARTEIDAGAEAARLAAARREALEALVADLESENDANTARITALEADQLTSAAAAEALRERLANADTELTAMTLNLERQRQEAEDTLTLLAAARAAQAELDARNATLTAELEALQGNLGDEESEAERQAALLALANEELAAQEALSAESQRQVALLNEQITELRTQVGNLQSMLNLAEEADREAQVQIETLGAQLNTALARVVTEERRRRALEEAERIRLEAEAARLEEEAERLAAEAENLSRFKSDFFGELRQILEGQDRIRIEGDRFIFASEVLFEPGSADLSPAGEAEIANIADILRSIADDIPEGIDWVIRVDGHTDNIPVGAGSRFADNWELSQARALSVVRFMSSDLGIDPRRLAANGFGEYQPLNPADTPEARAQNRRIELKLTER